MEILFIGDEQAIQTFVDQQLTSILFEPNESHTGYSVDIVSGAWKYLLDSINICRSSEYLDVECRKSADLVLLFNNNHKSILPHYIQVGNQNDIVNFEKKKKIMKSAPSSTLANEFTVIFTANNTCWSNMAIVRSFHPRKI